MADVGMMTMSKDGSSWWLLALPSPAFSSSSDRLLHDAYVLLPSLLLAFLALSLLTWALSPGGIAWTHGRNRMGPLPIPGPRGLPVFGSLLALRSLPHRALASAAASPDGAQLTAFSLGSTPAVVSSDPRTAREILSSPAFADRPLKRSARSLMFERAIGFAPAGAYWRLLRRVAASHLFAPRRVSAHGPARLRDCAAMAVRIAAEQKARGFVVLRDHLQLASLNSVMGSVFGKRYDAARDAEELEDLRSMVREGFELLGAFNWSDYVPWLRYVYDPFRVDERCARLVPRVKRFVGGIIADHRQKNNDCDDEVASDEADFVDVLLSLDGDEKLDEDDMVAILWEMIFRGTDTTALLTEWIMAELVLHPRVQEALREELADAASRAGGRVLTDADMAGLPYLQAVVKEGLRMHPPGPLLSWARLSTADVQLGNGMVVPAGTTAMVNMWAIARDPGVWEDPHSFRPERFLEHDVDVRGGDLRLAPFGSGRRVCPGKNLGLATVTMWVAELVRRFKWAENAGRPVDLSEVLKLSCEMKHPLHAVAVERNR
ncbi:cytochrome P450 78A7-like [Rhodamnia argentea]|uniref:Cytochrome P450 78A7-like n=1 Tax=Rhodamnia argentea TaxID=178133 RepID=A0A8B8NXZ8_9MYRT|nr:cytochrome P450 78A7-like [Rhodamnia argentea]